MEWLKQYRYPIIAGLIGVFLACLIVSFGFFKTIFVLILGALGVAAGLYIEKNYIRLVRNLVHFIIDDGTN
ncbi:DUF2273 domain-containing protein [Streptococcus pneumoniae]|nr:DUF2273 domain-containing protein [Streptococcus pneumoniae]